MTLKRPVTVAQALRWPGAAKRRQSFCARMGGMREKLTGKEAASDPESPINRALAAWDCDDSRLLDKRHVSKGIRPMKITTKMVGSEARKNPARKTAARKDDPFPSPLENYGPRKGLEGPFLMRNNRVVYYDPAEGAYYDPTTDFYLSREEAAGLHSNPAARKWLVVPRIGKHYIVGSFSTEQGAKDYMQTLNAPWNYKVKRAAAERPARKVARNPVKYRDIAKGVEASRVQYAVHWPDRPSYHAMAYFTKKSDAVEVAEEASNRVGKPIAVSRVQIHFGPIK